ATSATIGGEPVDPASGTAVVNPNTTTAYTLAATNAMGTSEAAVTVTVAANLQHPRIAEFLAKNDSGLTDDDGDHSDWIELHNPTGFFIDLAGYALTNDAATPAMWVLPPRVLAPGERIVVFASGKDRADPGAVWHTNFTLDADGDYLALIGADGAAVIQEFAPAFPPQSTGIAYGISDANSATGFLAPPTPGQPNLTDAYDGVLKKKVDFATPGGLVFDASISVALTHEDPEATIRYTMDGSIPTAASPAYTAPLELAGTVLVKAGAFRDGYVPGPLSQESYLFADAEIAGFDSDLPVLVIDTFNTALPRDDREFKDAVFAAFEPAADTGRTTLTGAQSEGGNSGIHVRGESSALPGFNKLNFSFETRNTEGEDKDVPLFGFPADSDWALHASEIDRTFIRERLPHYLFNEIGRYSARTRPVEIFLNQGGGKITAADYRGLYLLIERVKRSKDRVDVAKLGPLENTGENVTGGYIFKKDKANAGDVNATTASSGDFAITYPAEDRITGAQVAYLQSYLRDFEAALNGASFTDLATGYAAYIDVASWIDFHVIQEFTKEVDSYIFSTYFHKDRGGKIECGPLWDFDRSFGNTQASGEQFPEGWRGDAVGARGVFWARLFQDPDFLQLYIDRWQALMETHLHEAHLFPIIDAMAVEVGEAKDRNFQPAGPWPLANVTRSHLTFPTYEEHVDYVKSWISSR
ncbi:MAG: CotH kinase family protein, partial [Verrucomicrobiales bacterium]